MSRDPWTDPDPKPGDFDARNALHDHRFMPGQPGMGMMPGGHGMHGGMKNETPAKRGGHEGHP